MVKYTVQMFTYKFRLHIYEKHNYTTAVLETTYIKYAQHINLYSVCFATPVRFRL